ncbi:hypothetical protein ACTI_31450 [Actinoplanes sp. OR16]|uniref:DUF5343 domain-containing protein n=1 Tax=Actinoplanes sp. OR16 TaxID=946334 RepID=UPI000F715D66|nr:DUF5343 domain-containing protein [Actinoplanes sp. OR16]BBH66460.1 hypothetical protein ACTI_31450 [Actinoplanes sp. OR16]
MTDDASVAQEPLDPRRPPYPGFGAFTSFQERLRKNGIPAVIDRPFVGGSGTNQSLMLGALKYLDLVNGDNEPTQALHDLTESEEADRRAVLAKLVETHYAGALALGPRATQGQLDGWFRQQGVSGETARKAQSFFLSLAKAAGIEVSPHYKVTRASPAAGRKRAAGRRRPESATPAENAVVQPQASGASNSQIHASVQALLQRIPAEGMTWTQRDKDLLVATFSNLLDLFHPVSDPMSARGGEAARPAKSEVAPSEG